MDWLRAAIIDAGGFPEVAAASGISLPHLYAIARGHRALTSRTARALAPVLTKVSKKRWTEAFLFGPVSKADTRPRRRVKREVASEASA